MVQKSGLKRYVKSLGFSHVFLFHPADVVSKVRAKGYSFTVFGWAIGCGMTGFVIPIMLQRLGWVSILFPTQDIFANFSPKATFIFFGAMNIVVMPFVYFLYPEVSGRSLEEIDLLFTSDSVLVSKNMAEYDRRIAEAGGNIAVAARRLLDEVDGTTHLDPRRISVVSKVESGDFEEVVSEREDKRLGDM